MPSETARRRAISSAAARASAWRAARAAPARQARVSGRVLLVGALLGGALWAGTASAQPAGPEDWPCIQVLVPEVSPATMWPRALEPSLDQRWVEDEAVATLARRLGSLERLDTADSEAIAALAQRTPESERAARLDLLAVGTVQVTNERRSRFIDGIRRYTRQQIAIAEQIEGTLNELARSGEGSQAGLVTERSEVQETLAWHQRLYDQRERAIRALCEQPVVLEETLFSVMRELQMRLPAS